MDESLEIMRRCFQPRQWFTGEGEPDPFVVTSEDSFMWVYRSNDRDGYLVGFYAPDGSWFTESEHDTKEVAAQRVNFLNGGRGG